MADKAITELVAAEQITATDLFVLQQNNTAKKLPSQVLLNWLTAAADGHGGIQSIVKLSTSGLADTYRITLADTTTFDFVVNNGRSIGSIVKIGTSGLVDTYRINYNDNTTDTFAVSNGAKGEKGDNTYIWIKYASQEPTASSHSFGDLPDTWIGIYFGTSSIAPSDWQQYKWYQWKGAKGDKGDPATLVSSNVEYQVSSSGTVVPSGSWSSSVPLVPQGMYLWTKNTNTFNTGSPVISYSVSRMGLDGSGAVTSVANISPDTNGNVPLTAEHVGALPNTGGNLTGELNMNGQPISGLNAPTANDQAANMGYVNQQMKKAAPWNLLDNSYFRNPVNQRGKESVVGSVYGIDRWKGGTSASSITVKPGEGIFIPANGTQTILIQRFAPGTFGGKKVTFAVGLDTGEIIMSSYTVPTSGNVVSGGSGGDNMFLSIDARNGYEEFRVGQSANAIVGNTVIWAALYEGEYTAETLPEYNPKEYGAELLACQTQLQRFHTEVERKTYCEDFRPTMRMTPNGTVSKFDNIIDGVTYYFASAEL